MSCVGFTAILKYLTFLGQEQTDSQQCVLFSRHIGENVSLTVNKQLMLLKLRCPFTTFGSKKLDECGIK